MSGKKNKAATAITARKPKPVIGKKAGGLTNWLLVLVALLPFIINPTPLDPVFTPRYIFLSLFLLAFVANFFLVKKRPVSFAQMPQIVKMIFIVGLAYFAWSLISMFSSINYREGYLDTFRHALHLILLYVIICAGVQEDNAWLRIAKTLTVVAILQGLVGILQYYEMGFTGVPGAFSKPWGLMANRNFFGSAQVYLLPFSIFVLAKGSRSWKWVAAAALAILVFSITISQTRSAWLATMAMLIVCISLTLLFATEQRRAWLKAFGLGITGAALLVALIFLGDGSGRLQNSLRERVASLAGPSGDSSNAALNVTERFKIWNKTIDVIRDHPVFGTGPGNWKIVFPTYGTTNTQFEDAYYSPDRPHNVYLQVASETGIPGAILYFSMWLMIGIAGLRALLKAKDENERLLLILMLGGLAAVATDFFFSFPIDRIEHSLYMFLMAGIVISVAVRQSRNSTSDVGKPGPVIWIPALLIIAFNLLLGIKNFNFEVTWKNVKAYNSQQLFSEVPAEAASGKNAYAVMDLSGVPLELFTAYAYKQMKNHSVAFAEIQKAANYNPYNSRIFSEWGTIHADLQQYDSAVFYYKKALALTPKFVVAIKNLAAAYYAMGKDSACLAELDKLDLRNDPQLQDMRRQVGGK